MSSLCQVYIVVCLKNMLMIFRKGNENSPKRCFLIVLCTMLSKGKWN